MQHKRIQAEMEVAYKVSKEIKSLAVTSFRRSGASLKTNFVKLIEKKQTRIKYRYHKVGYNSVFLLNTV